MATTSEIVLSILTEYRKLLDKIEIFGKRYPDNIEGYNYLIDMASELYHNIEIVGLSQLPPLPQKK
jgi:hypothetical protein